MTEQKPEKVFTAWPVQASVFFNERIIDGVGRDLPSVNFQKRYQEKENGQWKSTTSLNVNDLPKAVYVLNQAYGYLVSRAKKDVPETNE